MDLEEDKITNLLYLVNQLGAVSITDRTEPEKRAAIARMVKLGLLKNVTNDEYSLDDLGLKIVASKKSYSQYLAHIENTGAAADDAAFFETNKDQSFLLRLLNQFKTGWGILIAILLLGVFLLYWFAYL